MARLVIEPKSVAQQYWRDLWRYRELFAMLAWCDVAVRYKQTVIGIAWAVIRPIFAMIIWYGAWPNLQVLAVIPLTLLAAVLALGPGLFLATLNARYRDFRHALP